jgi:hypothetical protein
MTNTSSEVGIDPRSPRFGAAITTVLLALVLIAGLNESLNPASGLIGRWLTAAGILLSAIVVLFAIGASGIQRHPYGALFRKLIRPRLSAPTHMENPKPPTFAQLVGFFITGVGLVLHLGGLPLALVIAVAMAFVAAFLNAAFGLCLGCELYGLMLRVRGAR